MAEWLRCSANRLEGGSSNPFSVMDVILFSFLLGSKILLTLCVLSVALRGQCYSVSVEDSKVHVLPG